MTGQMVLVVGAGLAGLGAAVELVRAGQRVTVVDQTQAAGGAIHRQPLPGRPSIARAAEHRRWQSLMAEVRAAGIEILTETRFGGIDSTGEVLLTGAALGFLRPKALVLATGAREAVQPRPGWTLPGVMTVGAIQTYLKTQAAPPPGRIALAGSGPLLLAAAAQLCALGRPPVAVIEAGRPFAHPLAALRLPPGYLAEAAAYMRRLVVARVLILTASHVTRISKDAAGLTVEIERGARRRRLACDLVGLHDGIRPNDAGLPDMAPIPVVRLGDCREALGARAALADGRNGGQRLAAQLSGALAPALSQELQRQRRAQGLLARIYANDGADRLTTLPGDTVLCQCEMRTLDDLRALGPAPTDRMLRLDGRFSMGPCQGRFCAEWVQRLAGRSEPARRIGAARYPAAPIAVADLLAAQKSREGESP